MAIPRKPAPGWLSQHTLPTTFYAAVVLVILTLTGMFGNFAEKDVITGRLALHLVALVLVLGVPAWFVVRPLVAAPAAQRLLNGALCGGLLALVLATMVFIEASLESIEGLVFVFQNYRPLSPAGLLTYGFSGDGLVFPGLLLLILTGAGIGALLALAVRLPGAVLSTAVISAALLVVFGLMALQIRAVISLPEALVLLLTLSGGYGVARWLPAGGVWRRAAGGAAAGLVAGGLVLLLVNGGALAPDGLLAADAAVTRLLLLPELPRLMVLVLVGLAGALLTLAAPALHQAGWLLAGGLVAFGVLNASGRMNDVTALLTLLIFAGTLLLPRWLLPAAAADHAALPPAQRVTVNRCIWLGGLAVLLVAPVFLGQYITNVLDLVMLYIIMGIGLNIMVGYAGLLDLGYVASFAIGAYACALLTTPSVITLGCVDTATVAGLRHYEMCVGAIAGWPGIGILTFWQALPLAILASACAGMLLGIPVLRLRGDYFAIVTLGFGEITRVITRASITEPLLGSAQGISPIPFPVINLSAVGGPVINLDSAQTVYYIYVGGVLLAIFVLTRLAGSRIGRAWRAMRADEDAAEAMGVNLVRMRLLAFALSAAFAGMSGAFFGAQLRGIFPDSFTILVSINVLSLIIIGGLGSIPGVIVGALMLVGLPEALRELQDYRLLAFGVLLVVAMLLRPQGLIPPAPRQLATPPAGGAA
ncbi:MAG: hypothetical protein MUE40_13275 [Anaerolineae bacterium]|nr:hypothetical protein [Anaerolineae bacterium]